MTLAQMLTVIDNHGFDNIDDTDQIQIVNNANAEIVHGEPWPWREATKTLAFAGSSSTTSTSVTDVDEILNIVNTGTGRIIQPAPGGYQWIQNRFGTDLTEDNDPLYYYHIAGTLHFYPRPPSSVSLDLFYLKVQAAVAAGAAESEFLIPPRWHHMLVWKALVQFYMMEDDLTMAGFFENKFDRDYPRMLQDGFIRQLQRAETVQVVDEDDYEIGFYL